MTKATIRTAQLEDIPDIVRLAQRFLLTTPYGRLFRFEPARIAQLAEKVLELGTIWVAECLPYPETGETRLVGFLAVVEGLEPYSGQAYAEEVAWFVEPEHRRGVAGPRLLEAFEKWGRDKNLTFCKMVAPVEVGSDLAGFLNKRGYSALETAFVKRFT